MKKIEKQLLGGGILVCLLITVILVAWIYPQRHKQIIADAEATFRLAVENEIDRRADISYRYRTFGYLSTSLYDDTLRATITAECDEGKYTYHVPVEKRKHNIYPYRMYSGKLSYLFYQYPMSVDSVHCFWKHLLEEKHIRTENTGVRYSRIATSGKTFTDYSGDVDRYRSMDSLTVWYIGSACEVEVTAYFSSGFGDECRWKDIPLLLFSWLLLGGLWGFIHIRKELESPVDSDTPACVKDLPLTAPETYRFPDGTCFDPISHFLEKGQKRFHLAPQSSALLMLFLHAEGRELSSDEINQAIWKGHGTSERLYTIIHRLKKDLQKVSFQLTIQHDSDGYRLIFLGNKPEK